MAVGIRQEAGGLLTGDERQGPAHIDRHEGGIPGGMRNQLEEAMFFLTATAAEADQLEGVGADALRDGIESEVVGGLAVVIAPGGGAGLVESEPVLRLFQAVVVELVVDAAGAERGVQFCPHAFGQLRGMDADLDDRGGHLTWYDEADEIGGQVANWREELRRVRDCGITTYHCGLV